MKSRWFFIGCLLVLGFILRLILASYVSPALEWDSLYYSSYANAILGGDIRANCCNIGSGYPIFVGAIYLLFGKDNIWGVRIIQILLDLTTAGLLYLSAKNLWNREKISLFVFIIYLINPFTASYTGHILTETLTLFFVGLTVYLISLKKFLQSPALWAILGLVVGLGVFVKVGLYQWSLLLAFLLALICFRSYKKLLFLLIFGIGFITASSYSLYTNYQSFKVISIIPPYRSLGGALYTSLFRERSGELQGDWVPQYRELDDYYPEYFHYYNYSPQKFPEFNYRYLQLFKENLKTRWPNYVRFVTRNIFWIWDKYHLFVYKDAFYPGDAIFLRILNIVFLAVQTLGILFFVKSGGSARKNPVIIMSVSLMLVITFVFTLLNNETRLSIPYYPVACLWFGYAVNRILSKY